MFTLTATKNNTTETITAPTLRDLAGKLIDEWDPARSGLDEFFAADYDHNPEVFLLDDDETPPPAPEYTLDYVHRLAVKTFDTPHVSITES